MRLDKIVTIAWHEYRTNVRRIGFIFVTLLFPALGLVGLITAGFFSGQARSLMRNQFVPQTKPAGIVDDSHLFTPIAPSFAKGFTAFADEESAKRALLLDTIRVYYVIASDYITTGKVTAYTENIISGSASSESGDLQALLVKGLLSGKVDDVILTRAANPIKLDLVTLDSKGKSQVGGAFSFIAGFVTPYIFSILLFMAVFAASGYLLRSVSEEKESRVIEIILSSVSPIELLAGKVIGLGALGLTQVAVWLGSGFLLSGGIGALVAGAVVLLNPGSFVLATLYFLLGYLLFGSLMAAAGSLGTSMRESQQIAGLFTFCAVIPWFFWGVLLTNPNALLPRVLSFFPLTAPTMMMLRLPITDVPAIDIFGSLIVLLISIPITLWAGARVFRMGLLMYGKRPAIKEIWRALRNA
jgi:ABC-2 type transport system permease protein